MDRDALIGAVETVHRELETVLAALETQQAPAAGNDRKAQLFAIAAAAVTALAAGAGALLGPAGAAAAALASGCVFLLLRPKQALPAQQRMELNEAVLKTELDASRRALKQLCEFLDEQKVGEIPDIRKNKDFARWVQMFALHAVRSGSHNVLQLYRQLKEELEYLGIYVYETLETDESGAVKLPREECFADMRAGDEWTKVLLPAVYTETDVLMSGQII